MRFVGIDPGFLGALSFIDDIWVDKQACIVYEMPIIKVEKGKTKKGNKKIKHYINEEKLKEVLLIMRPDITYVESVAARPHQGVVSMFSFGTGWGILRGMLVGLGMQYKLVRPQEWKKEVLQGYPKNSELVVAEKLFPDVNFFVSPRSKKFHDGLVDAALITEYCRRKEKK